MRSEIEIIWQLKIETSTSSRASARSEKARYWLVTQGKWQGARVIKDWKITKSQADIVGVAAISILIQYDTVCP